MSAGYALDSRSDTFPIRARRVGGLAGLGFVVGVILQNAVLSRGGPLPDATVAEVARHFEDAGAGAVAMLALVAVNMTFLFLFGSTARERLRVPGTADVMSRMAIMGVVLLSAMFGATAIFQTALVAGGDSLAARPETTALLWDLHTAALVLSQLSLGLVLFGFSAAALAAGDLTPRWLSWAGIAGSATLVVGGALPVAALDGSPTFFIGFVGFFIWMVWLATASLTLARS